MLKVFDMLGREVATLVDEQLNAGAHAVVFDANGLASGLYFYRLTTLTFSQTLFMEVLKTLCHSFFIYKARNDK